MTVVGVVAVQLAWWMRVGVGLVVMAVVVPGAVALFLTVRSVVASPRAAGRRWPEGAGWGGLAEPVAVGLRVVQQEDRLPSGTAPVQADLVTVVPVGLLAATLAVIPVTGTLVVSHAGLGLLALPVLATLAVAVGAWGSPAGDPGGGARRERARVRLLGALLLGMTALAVAAQWGSFSLAAVAERQATSSFFGVRAWGVPTALPQPVALLAALLGVHLLAAGSPPGMPETSTSTGLRRAMEGATDALAVLAGAAWVVVALLGGGGVPWTTSRAGVVTVVGVVLFAVKVIVLAAGLVWASARWPAADPDGLHRPAAAVLVPLVGLGAIAALLGRLWF